MTYIENCKYLATYGNASGVVRKVQVFSEEACIDIRLGGLSSGMIATVTVSEKDCLDWLERMRQARLLREQVREANERRANEPT